MKYIPYSGNYSKEKINFHKHDKGYEIFLYASGTGKLNIDGKFYEAKKGMIVIMPPNIIHGSISIDNLSYVAILASDDEFLHLDTPIIVKDNEKNDGLALMQMILSNRYDDSEFFNSLCHAFIHFILKNVKITNPTEKAVNKIKSQITANLHDSNLNVAYLLNQSGYAEDYIRANFKKIVGKTPVEFLNELRIKNAISLIKIYKNTMPLMDVAISCGFDDYIYFSRKFKEITSLSPQAYKNLILSDVQK